MEIIDENKGAVLFVSITGDLNAHTSPDFEKYLLGVIESGQTRIVVDGTNLKYISSAGLRVVLAACKMLGLKKGKLSFCCMQDQVRDVFEVAGFGGVVSIFPSRETAEKFSRK